MGAALHFSNLVNKDQSLYNTLTQVGAKVGIDVNVIGGDIVVTIGDINLTELAGNPVSVGNGNTDSGTLRVTLADDSTGEIAVTQGSSPWQCAIANSSSGGTISSLGGGSTAGFSALTTLGISIEGTFVGTIQVTASMDGINYETFKMIPFNSGAVVSSAAITSPGVWVANLAGAQSVKIISTAWTSGSADFVLVATSTTHVAQILSADPSNVLVTAYQGGSWAVSGTGTFTVVQPTAANLNATVVFASPQHVIVDSGSIVVTQTTAANLNATIVFASPQHVIVDSGSITFTNASIAVTQATAANLNATVVFPSAQHVIVDSGTVTANIGTTGGLALDTSVNGLLVTQGSTTSGQSGPLVQTATTTNAPTYTTGKTNPLSTDTSGLLRISLKDTPANTNKFLVTADAITFASPQHVILDSGTLTSITNTVNVSVQNATLAVTQSTSPWVVSGTVTANIGTTGGLALDTSVNGILLAQGSTTSGQTGPLVQTATTTNAPTYTTGKTNPLSTDTSGLLRISLKDTPQNTNKFLVTADAITFASPQHVILDSGTLTSITNTVTISGTVTANIGTTGGLALDTSVNGILLAQGSTTSGQSGPLMQGAVTTNAPTYTTGKTDPLSLDTSGLLRISLKDTPANTNKFLVTADPITFASAQHVILDSGTLTTITNPVTVAQATAANLNATVVFASAQPVTQSGTWTVQQGSPPWSVFQSGSWTVTANAGTGTFTTTDVPATSGGLLIKEIDALSNTATAVKTSAGQVYGYHIANSGASDAYVHFYNIASGSVVVGTSTRTRSLYVPAGGTVDSGFSKGLAFGTAITVAATTTLTGSGAPATGILVNIDYF